jgi:ribosomal protein S1
VTEPTEDFAAMFEASIKAKRVVQGQTIEGTIVAIGPEVAFIDVGGKGEATIDIDEPEGRRWRSRRSQSATASRPWSLSTVEG